MQNSTATFYTGGILGLAIGGATVFSSQVSKACKPASEIATVVAGEGSSVLMVTEDGVETTALAFIQPGYGVVRCTVHSLILYIIHIYSAFVSSTHENVLLSPIT